MAKDPRKAVAAAPIARWPAAVVAEHGRSGSSLARGRAHSDRETERLRRANAPLEDQLTRLRGEKAHLADQVSTLRAENAGLERRSRRRSRAIGSLLLTVEVKAFYCMSISSWWDSAWWANVAQAATGAVVASYLIWPNARTLARNLVRLSRDPE
jgi:hypothetical protein